MSAPLVERSSSSTGSNRQLLLDNRELGKLVAQKRKQPVVDRLFQVVVPVIANRASAGFSSAQLGERAKLAGLRTGPPAAWRRSAISQPAETEWA